MKTFNTSCWEIYVNIPNRLQRMIILVFDMRQQYLKSALKSILRAYEKRSIDDMHCVREEFRIKTIRFNYAMLPKCHHSLYNSNRLIKNLLHMFKLRN